MTNDTLGNIDLDADDAIATIRPIPWAQFRRELLEEYKPPLRAAATWYKMKRAFDVLEAINADDGSPMVSTTADLTKRLIARYVTSRPPAESANTTISLLRCIRVMANTAVADGYLRISPFARHPLRSWIRKSPPKGKRILSREEIRRILDVLAADVTMRKGWRQWKARRIQAMVAVLAYTGLRAKECSCLHVDDIDLAGRIIHVRPHGDHKLKTHTAAAPVPIPPALVPIVEDWLRHRLDAPKGFEMPASVPSVFPGVRRRGSWEGGPGHRALDVFKTVARRAGIEYATFQMLRRSLSTHMRYFGVSSGVAARILRHSVEIDEHFYNHPDEDNLRDAVKNVEF
jgi:integrase